MNHAGAAVTNKRRAKTFYRRHVSLRIATAKGLILLCSPGVT